MAKETRGCFAWFITFKQACNERWAKFRNRFRRRFYARRGQSLEPTTLLNETGSKDMVIARISYASTLLDKLVEDYVSGIITTAAQSLLNEAQESIGNATIISVKPAQDNVSLSSSIISQIADAVVTESMTRIVMDTDTNQSAQDATLPKTVNEFIELLGITRVEEANDGLPAVSD